MPTDEKKRSLTHDAAVHRAGIAALEPDDKKGLIAFGIDLAVRQCTELLEADVPGLHIYTMDRSASAVGIVNKLREAGNLN